MEDLPDVSEVDVNPLVATSAGAMRWTLEFVCDPRSCAPARLRAP